MSELIKSIKSKQRVNLYFDAEVWCKYRQYMLIKKESASQRLNEYIKQEVREWEDITNN